jgi:large subunit ribosomal protein L10e
MAKKPARMYTRIRGQSFARRDFAGGVPNPRITQFDLGDPNGEFTTVLKLVADEKCQIRHNALESARIAANRLLVRKLGKSNFYMKILIYPHEILRENKQATGAGADRVSQGMRKSFGKPVSTAARVDRGQELIRLMVNDPRVGRESLRRAAMKLPTPCRIVTGQCA